MVLSINNIHSKNIPEARIRKVHKHKLKEAWRKIEQILYSKKEQNLLQNQKKKGVGDICKKAIATNNYEKILHLEHMKKMTKNGMLLFA